MWRAALRLRLLGWEESRAGVSLSVQCCSQTITRTKTHWVSGLTVYSVGLLFRSYQVKMIKVNWFCTVNGLYKVLLIESWLKFHSPQNIWQNFSFSFFVFLLFNKKLCVKSLKYILKSVWTLMVPKHQVKIHIYKLYMYYIMYIFA